MKHRKGKDHFGNSGM